MRLRHPLVFGVAAVGLLLVAAPAAQACWFFGKKHHRPMYVAPPPAYCPPGPGFAAPPPMYAAPPGYRVAPPGYAAPPMYRVPGQGTYVQPAPMPGMSGVPGTGARPMPAAPATASSVAARDNVFEPPTLHVRPGTTVRWTNNGRNPHTVTDRDGKFDSGDIAPGGSFTHTFQTPGTYRYHCKHHKGMEGTIVVGEPGKGPGAGGGPAGGSKGPPY